MAVGDGAVAPVVAATGADGEGTDAGEEGAAVDEDGAGVDEEGAGVDEDDAPLVPVTAAFVAAFVVVFVAGGAVLEFGAGTLFLLLAGVVAGVGTGDDADEVFDGAAATFAGGIAVVVVFVEALTPEGAGTLAGGVAVVVPEVAGEALDVAGFTGEAFTAAGAASGGAAFRLSSGLASPAFTSSALVSLTFLSAFFVETGSREAPSSSI